MADIDFFDTNEFKQLLRQYESSLASGDSLYMDASEFVDIADYYNLKGKTQQAIDAINAAIELHPEASEPHMFLARLAIMNDHDPDRAQAIIDEITDKDSCSYHIVNAEIMLARGQVDEANEYLHAKLDTIDMEYKEDFILDVAGIMVDNMQEDYAAEWLEYSELTEDDDYLLIKAKALTIKGEASRAEKILSTLLDRQPFSSSYWTAICSTQIMQARYAEAITSAEYAIAIEPENCEAILNKANALYMSDQLEKALDEYHRYAQLRPTDPTIQTHIGTTLMLLERNQEAIKYLREALSHTVEGTYNNGEAHKQLAFALANTGHTDEAIAHLDIAAQAPGINPDDILVIKGHTCLCKGRILEAHDHFKDAVINSHFDPHILYSIAVSLFDNNLYSIARRILLEMLNHAESTWQDGFSHLAYCEYRRENNTKSAEYLRHACKVNPFEVRIVFSEHIPKDIENSELYPLLAAKLYKDKAD